MDEHREERGYGFRPEAPQRVLCSTPHPPPLVGEQARDRRRSGRSEDMTGGAGRVNPNEPLGVAEACECRRSDCRTAPAPECLDRGGADVGIRVPGKRDQAGLAELRVGAEERCAPEANRGARVSQQRQELRARGRCKPLELGGDPRARAVPAAKRRDEETDRPLVADVAERPDGSGCDARVRVGEHGQDEARHSRVVRLLEPDERGDAAPLPPLRARSPAHATDESLGRAGAEHGRDRLAPLALVAYAPEDDDQREQDPRRKCECEHDDSHAENKRVHPLVVVAGRAGAVPRSRDQPLVGA